MKKILLLAALISSTSFTSMAVITPASKLPTLSDSFSKINFKKVLDLSYFVLPEFSCVPKMIVFYDAEIDGDYNTAYSAALDYMLYQAGQC